MLQPMPASQRRLAATMKTEEMEILEKEWATTTESDASATDGMAKRKL